MEQERPCVLQVSSYPDSGVGRHRRSLRTELILPCSEALRALPLMVYFSVARRFSLNVICVLETPLKGM